MHEKGKNKRKKRKEKKEKQKTATLKPGIPSLIIIIESSNPTNHPLHLSSFIFHHLRHLHSPKNPTISMLNSNLAYQKKKLATSNKQQATTNQVCLSRETRKTHTSPDNDHVHTPNSRILSAPQSFRLRRDNMSNVDKVPTSLSRQTNTLASFDQSVRIYIFFLFSFGGTYPRSSRSTIRNSR